MNNLFSEYEPVVVIGESSIHNLFFRHNSILVIINKLKVISTYFRCVKLFFIRTASLLKRIITIRPHKHTNVN